MKTLLTNFTTIMAFGMLTVSMPVFAQTSDDGAVCDAESGAAYGLCNAYCEAMDCDESDPQASDVACLKVMDRYIQITGQALDCGVVSQCCLPNGYDAQLTRSECEAAEGVYNVIPEGMCELPF